MKKNSVIILLLILIFTLFGCTNNTEPKETIVSISIIESTIPERILVSELEKKLSDIQIEVTLSNGNTKIINLDSSMLFPNDIMKLKSGGKYKMKVTYEFVTTDIILNTFLVLPIIYTIKVLKPDGTPVVDTNIRLLKDNNTYRNLTTDSNGCCSIELNPEKYTFEIELLEKGYMYYKTDCVLNVDNPSKTINLINVMDILDGEGTNFNPYIVNCGIYKLTFEQENILGMKYYKFVAPETKEYTIESIAYSSCTNKSVDPYLIFVDKDGEFDKTGNFDSTINVDFKYSFEAEAGKSYSFMIFISTASEYPVDLVLKISE